MKKVHCVDLCIIRQLAVKWVDSRLFFIVLVLVCLHIILQSFDKMNFVAGMTKMGGFPPVFVDIFQVKSNKRRIYSLIVYRNLSGIMFAITYSISAEISVL